MNEKISFCVFANFLINSEERFQRLRDSFQSFYKISPDEWIINIRGSYKFRVANYLEKSIKANLKLSFKDTKKGWIYDTKFLSNEIDSDLVMLWIEDHLLVNDLEYFRRILEEIINCDIDIFEYSWFQEINKKFFYAINPIYKSKNLDFIFYDQRRKDLLLSNKKYKDSYLISMQSIMKKSFFKKILNMKNPYLKRWPKKYPFDFEKKIIDCKGLNFKFGFPKNELFASIDDDHDEENYSLISRGLYPQRLEKLDLNAKKYREKFLYKFIARVIPKTLFKLIKNIYIFFKRLKNTAGYFI